MNESINLVEILKDCPKGTKLYSPLYGEVLFKYINEEQNYPIIVEEAYYHSVQSFGKHGEYDLNYRGECMLFPSKEQRDWSKFKVNKPKFDINTIQPFDKVLALINGIWRCDWFSHLAENGYKVSILIGLGRNDKVIPYNKETKHLVGTKDEVPEYYRYWDD